MLYAQKILTALPALTYIGVMRTWADMKQLDAKDFSLSTSCVYFRVVTRGVPRLEPLGEDESRAIHEELLSMQSS